MINEKYLKVIVDTNLKGDFLEDKSQEVLNKTMQPIFEFFIKSISNINNWEKFKRDVMFFKIFIEIYKSFAIFHINSGKSTKLTQHAFNIMAHYKSNFSKHLMDNFTKLTYNIKEQR